VSKKVDRNALKRAQTTLVAEAIYAQEDLKSLANIYGYVVSSGLDLDYVEQWPEQIKDVSANQVRKAAQHLFTPKNQVTGYLLPKEVTP